MCNVQNSFRQTSLPGLQLIIKKIFSSFQCLPLTEVTPFHFVLVTVLYWAQGEQT